MPRSSAKRVARVLVVERDPFMREALEQILGAQYNVMVVEDGRAALEAAKRSPPDIIVMELLLPGMDGFQLLRHLKADPATRQVPVVVFSVLLAADRCLRMGADAFVEKPHHVKLLSTVQRVLERRDEGHEVREDY